ncbi:precorrin-2 dehydrogenase/sirohydrochlorin ferrochelatase family protein [Desulfotomaculum copahuensis]|uniref:precorrin-2 dehydrogenase n=1 Tax=Desulfotomaculum copahuensis TaxID=1838280 RepID=A0A1B7LH32_9FIRM|nr:bifunctional precorrin-2 dehydrogenase/sirohydrochlorin ferrochelatase [Desulfotomaculum copahuensis]OAT85515.1 siroheme synthase [Desulfotomaculum copahuensis]
MSGCYPISLHLAGRRCLVVGGGSVAERKVLSLLACDARVTVVSPRVCPGLRKMAAAGRIDWHCGEYHNTVLDGIFLVIAATDQDAVNRLVSKECLERNLLVNVVDDPPHGNFYVPAVMRRGPLQIAVSTGGHSPLLARKIKEELARRYGPEYGEFAVWLGEIRTRLLENISDPEKRHRILASLVDDQVLLLLAEGRLTQAKERVEQCLSS